MDLLTILGLALLQGFAELLPVSSSAHVILACKWLGLNPSSPSMSFMLVMLHTGTMFAVLLYFWKRWRQRFSFQYVQHIVVATAVTGILGLGLKYIIEKWILEKTFGFAKGEVEQLFSILPLVGAAVFISGIMILVSGLRKARKVPSPAKEVANLLNDRSKPRAWRLTDSIWIGLVQGMVLPFRGLTRSGMTISTGLLRGLDQEETEDFSFALAVALTPAVLWHELHRFLQSLKVSLVPFDFVGQLAPALIGMVLSFFAGLLALKWLSKWLSSGRWYFFGIYCFLFSLVLFMSAEVLK